MIRSPPPRLRCWPRCQPRTKQLCAAFVIAFVASRGSRPGICQRRNRRPPRQDRALSRTSSANSSRRKRDQSKRSRTTRSKCSPPRVKVESASRSRGASYLPLAAEFLLTKSPCCSGRRRGTAPTSRRLSTGRASRLILRVVRFGPIPRDAPSVRCSSARPMACQRGNSRSTFRSDRFRMRRPMARLPKQFPAANAGYPRIQSLLNPQLRKAPKSSNLHSPKRTKPMKLLYGKDS